MGDLPKKFWKKWVDAYLDGDELKCHELVSKTLIGRDGGPKIGMATVANSFFMDLMEYMLSIKKNSPEGRKMAER